MNAYTLEFIWRADGERRGLMHVYAEGETLAAAQHTAGCQLKKHLQLTSLQLVDAFSHAECDKLQPCKNGVL